VRRLSGDPWSGIRDPMDVDSQLDPDSRTSDPGSRIPILMKR